MKIPYSLISLNMSKLNINNAEKITSGRKAVAVTGTAIALSATSISCFTVLVSASPNNSAIIYVGDSAVDDTAGSENGTPLQPNEKVSIDIDDVSKLYINGTAGDVLMYNALN